ncbi:hypothetical protein MOD14_10390 [Bacillus haynesii]|uniref:hypothetical protein n=1 Tax=Bacillus haynesii TaxID=1925021 RepID=UPI002280F7C1|nr:hypothetical protein [Bacillus haynesii]MCY8354575.1 hypothetical protein [Bacillus haynesii]MCY8540080.1 hypothetical protein [Bacillus haynesii]
MVNINFDDDFIEKIASQIADRAFELLKEKISVTEQLPHVLTRSEVKEVLKIKDTKIAELFKRPDFPVNDLIGKKVPTHMLFEWINNNTRWVEKNTDYFKKGVTA